MDRLLRGRREKNSAEQHVCIHAHRKDHQGSADRLNPRRDPTGQQAGGHENPQRKKNVASLTESKWASENLMSQLGVKATGSGCAKVILLAAIISAGTLMTIT